MKTSINPCPVVTTGNYGISIQETIKSFKHRYKEERQRLRILEGIKEMPAIVAGTTLLPILRIEFVDVLKSTASEISIVLKIRSS